MATSKTQTALRNYCSRMSESDKQANRAAFLHFFNSISNHDVSVSLLDGKKVSGQYYASTPFPNQDFRIIIKNARDSESAEGAPAAHTSFTQSEVSGLSISNIDLTSKAELMTDAAVRKKDLSHLSGRELQAASAWLLDPATSTSLDATSTADKHWNQFEVNQRLFNVKSSYDESIYTSKLDMSRLSKEQLEMADRIAKEIEGQTTDNIHLQEERGHLVEREMDEEDMYSGVIRSPTEKQEKPSPAAVSTSSSGGAWKKGSKIPASVMSAAGSPATNSKKGTSRGNSNESAETEGSWRKRGAPSSVGSSTTASASKAESKGKSDASVKPGAPVKADPPAKSEAPTTPPPSTRNGESDSVAPPGFRMDDNHTAPAEDTIIPVVSKADSAPDEKPVLEEKTAETVQEGTNKGPAEPVPAIVEEKPTAKPASKLNPNAKPFQFNANAAAFTPAAPTPEQSFPPVAAQQIPQPVLPYGMVPVPMYTTYPGQMYPMSAIPNGMPAFLPNGPFAPPFAVPTDGDGRPAEGMYPGAFIAMDPYGGQPGMANYAPMYPGQPQMMGGVPLAGPPVMMNAMRGPGQQAQQHGQYPNNSYQNRGHGNNYYSKSGGGRGYSNNRGGQYNRPNVTNSAVTPSSPAAAAQSNDAPAAGESAPADASAAVRQGAEAASDVISP